MLEALTCALAALTLTSSDKLTRTFVDADADAPRPAALEVHPTLASPTTGAQPRDGVGVDPLGCSRVYRMCIASRGVYGIGVQVRARAAR